MRYVSLVIGKFYPFHLGHAHLIDAAIAESELTIVLVLGNSNESLSIKQRQDWIRDHYRNQSHEIVVLGAVDDLPVDYSSREADRAHAEVIHEAVRHFRPNCVFSSEDYGSRLAEDLEDLGGHHVAYRVVDESRLAVPISATEIRRYPRKVWEFLPAAVRASLCKRVVVCGAESTGTTTLAKDLADLFETTCVPEMGRHYDWAVGSHHRWTTGDFLTITDEQKRWEDMLARQSDAYLICDTDEFATAMFHEVYLGGSCPEILRKAHESPADLYIVTDHVGVEFEDDGTRFNSGRRPWMTQWFLDNLPGRVLLVTGSRTVRVMDAQDALYSLAWDFYEPIELGKAAA